LHDYEWERLFVVLTAYFDESGTHGGSPITVMAAAMANVEQWAKYRRDLAHVKMRHGFNVFHAKEFKQRTGRFAGWSRERCYALTQDLSSLTDGKLMESVEFVLDNADYEKEYRSKEKPNKLALDSKYGLCFRQCLLYFILYLGDKFKDHADIEDCTFNVVLESGHKNAGAAVVIFEEIQKETKELGINLLGALSFAGKDQCQEFLLPDFLSYMAAHADRQRRAGRSYTPRLQSMAPPFANDSPPGGVTHLEFKPNGLAEIRGSLEKQLQARHSKRSPPGKEHLHTNLELPSSILNLGTA
jgi:Protein of unknown function (DUF3800)